MPLASAGMATASSARLCASASGSMRAVSRIWAETSASHHARILGALEAHDAHEAQRLMEHHVAESGDLAVGILQEMGYWDRDTDDLAEASESGAA